MKNTKSKKHQTIINNKNYQAIDYNNGLEESFTVDGDELPIYLEHITYEDLYEESIEDTSDDHLLKMMRGEIQRIR
jgi:hypothetical protein